MKAITLTTLYFFLTVQIIIAQADYKNQVSENGDHFIEHDNPGFLVNPNNTRAEQLQNIDPGISPEGDYMGMAVFSPDGQTVYLTNRGTNNLSIFDYADMELIANIDVGEYPSCIDANEQYVVVGCQFSDLVYIIDAVTYVVLDTVQTYEQPCKVHISPMSNLAYVACDIDDKCLEIDLASQSVTDTIYDFTIYLQTYSWATQSARNAVRYSDFIISPDGNGLIAHNGQDQLQYFEIASGTVTQSIGITSPRAIALSGDESKLVCVAVPDGVATLYQVSLPGFALSDSVEITGYGLMTNAVVVNQDGSKAYIGTNNNTSTLARFSTHDFKSFTGTYTAFWIGVSPDHRYVVSGQNHFAIVDFVDEVVTDLQTGRNQSMGVVSPVSNHIFSYDPLLFEGTYYYDFTDPSDVLYNGFTMSGEDPEGDAPIRVAMIPDQSKAVVVNNLSYNCSVIDFESKDVLGTVYLGEASHDVIATQDGNWAVCGGYNNNEVKVIDLSTYEIATTLNTGQRPMELTYAPMTSRVYAANIKSNSITVIDLDGANSSVVTSVPCGIIGVYIPFFGIRSGVEISPDEDYLLIAASFDDKLKVMDTETNQIVADLSVGDFPLSIAFNDDGSRALVTNLFDHSYSLISLEGASSSVMSTYPCQGDYPVNVNYNPAEDLFYICNYYSDNGVKVDAETGEVVETFNHSLYGGSFRVDFWKDEPVFLTVGGDVYDAGVLYRDEIVELPAAPSYMDVVGINGIGYAGMSIPGPDYLSVVNLDFSIGIDVSIGNPGDLLTISPNPATDIIKIRSWILDSGSWIIEIFSIEGRKMMEMEVEESKFDLDISELPSGIYFVRYECWEEVTRKETGYL